MVLSFLYLALENPEMTKEHFDNALIKRYFMLAFSKRNMKLIIKNLLLQDSCNRITKKGTCASLLPFKGNLLERNVFKNIITIFSFQINSCQNSKQKCDTFVKEEDYSHLLVSICKL